jgi:sugar phosphate permease
MNNCENTLSIFDFIGLFAHFYVGCMLIYYFSGRKTLYNIIIALMLLQFLLAILFEPLPLKLFALLLLTIAAIFFYIRATKVTSDAKPGLCDRETPGQIENEYLKG